MAMVGAVAMVYVDALTKGRPASTARYRATRLQRLLDWVGGPAAGQQPDDGATVGVHDVLARRGKRNLSRYVARVEHDANVALGNPRATSFQDNMVEGLGSITSVVTCPR